MHEEKSHIKYLNLEGLFINKTLLSNLAIFITLILHYCHKFR